MLYGLHNAEVNLLKYLTEPWWWSGGWPMLHVTATVLKLTLLNATRERRGAFNEGLCSYLCPVLMKDWQAASSGAFLCEALHVVPVSLWVSSGCSTFEENKKRMGHVHWTKIIETPSLPFTLCLCHS